MCFTRADRENVDGEGKQKEPGEEVEKGLKSGFAFFLSVNWGVKIRRARSKKNLLCLISLVCLSSLTLCVYPVLHD